ncbi:MAG TPA: DUF4783 domain-containing protein [Ignavibacteriaceae bacterium]|nr:DUF4783 domain-containing protein [Ignavibacteriaceae bacterium]
MFFSLLLASVKTELYPQEYKLLPKNSLTEQKTLVQSIFSEIESGVNGGNVSSISGFFSPQTYFSLSNGTSGYYSSNQAYYVLEDFFKVYQVISCRLKNIQADETNPYATGIYTYDFKGKREKAQVYISLKKSAGTWKISQITIN